MRHSKTGLQISVVLVRNGDKFNSPSFHFFDRFNDIVHQEGNVLHSCTSVIIQKFLQLLVQNPVQFWSILSNFSAFDTFCPLPGIFCTFSSVCMTDYIRCSTPDVVCHELTPSELEDEIVPWALKFKSTVFQNITVWRLSSRASNTRSTVPPFSARDEKTVYVRHVLTHCSRTLCPTSFAWCMCSFLLTKLLYVVVCDRRNWFGVAVGEAAFVPFINFHFTVCPPSPNTACRVLPLAGPTF